MEGQHVSFITMDQNPKYYTMWRGQRSGPFDISTLKEKLRQNEVSLLHKVLVKGSWVSMRSFLDNHKESFREPELPAEVEPEWEEPEREQQLAMEIERLESELRSRNQPPTLATAPPPGNPVYVQAPVAPPVADQSSLITAGWITLGLSFFLPPVAIVPFILGIILMAKSEVGHGVSMLLLSFVAPLFGTLFWVAIVDGL